LRRQLNVIIAQQRANARSLSMAARAASDRLDDAARAGWLYYVAGRTQEEIARQMGVSRQAAQRLVALAVSERIVGFRIDHPIARCMDLAAALAERFELKRAEVVPADRATSGGTAGLGEAGADEMARWLRRADPIVLAVGTGRTMKALAGQLPRLEAPQHRIVSLTGNIGPDGSAAYFNVIFTMAEIVRARHFPMPLPVFVGSAEERGLMHAQSLIRATLQLAAAADVAFVGIGEMDDTAPLFVDGFIARRELSDLRARGATGEICGWVFDGDGRFLGGSLADRTASAPIPPRDRATVIAVAKGAKKRAAVLAALRGRVVNGLITDEVMAEALLAAGK
jgi:DNA-binding transcriptional regulator LsrR (DeoR family)